MLLRAVSIGIALCIGMFGGQSSGTESRNRADDAGWLKAPSVKSAVERLEKQADNFEDKFEMALDKSSYNGSNTEDTLLRWADMLEDEIDDMAEDFKENDSRDFIDHFENSMMIASAINRAMLRKDFAAYAEADWRTLRQDLNTVATEMRRPVLPNVTVINLVPAVLAVLAKPDVKQALDQLEASTDRFEEKFRNALQHSTANMTDRQRMWNRWADYLERVTDDMLEEYKENDIAEVQEELERTLMVSEAINRAMLRSDLSGASESEWRNVRNQINVLANAFAYPGITNLISAP